MRELIECVIACVASWVGHTSKVVEASGVGAVLGHHLFYHCS